MEKTLGLNSIGERARKCEREAETCGGVRSNQVKRLDYIKFFNGC